MYHYLLEHERSKVYAFDGWEEIVRRFQVVFGGPEYVRTRGLDRKP